MPIIYLSCQSANVYFCNKLITDKLLSTGKLISPCVYFILYLVFCDADITCSSHGTCQADGSCLCNAAFTGSDCSSKYSDLNSIQNDYYPAFNVFCLIY